MYYFQNPDSILIELCFVSVYYFQLYSTFSIIPSNIPEECVLENLNGDSSISDSEHS